MLMEAQPEVAFVSLASFTPPLGVGGHFLFSAHGWSRQQQNKLGF